MLVLDRKSGEIIMIGDNISVTVLRLTGNRVTLGFSAPQTVSIRRSEITPKPRPSGGPPQPRR